MAIMLFHFYVKTNIEKKFGPGTSMQLLAANIYQDPLKNS